MMILYIRQNILKSCILLSYMYKLYKESAEAFNNIKLFKRYIIAKKILQRNKDMSPYIKMSNMYICIFYIFITDYKI
uniref:Uncharacterized protein n=1 Tax=Apapanepox virus TaxID=3049969 RepID=A0AAT9UQ94_9POXV